MTFVTCEMLYTGESFATTDLVVEKKRTRSCYQEPVSKENEFQKLVWQTHRVSMSRLLPFCICAHPAFVPACTSCGNKYSKTASQCL